MNDNEQTFEWTRSKRIDDIFFGIICGCISGIILYFSIAIVYF